MMHTDTPVLSHHTPPASEPSQPVRYRRRGRPRKFRPMHDCGTPELIMKRAFGLTQEALDLCLEKNIITPTQHWCGVHFRWLYSLRYGAPGARAVDTRHLGGIEPKMDDPVWRREREEEYLKAMELLGMKLSKILLKLAVYNERPTFLTATARNRTHPAFAKHYEQDKQLICEALEVLSKHWCRT